MEIDLQHAAASPGPIRSQVCIVGGGIAGIVLAHRLAARGVEITLLEAGGHGLQDGPHLGTTENPYRVFGGTSLGWGGQLLPLLDNPTGTPRNRLAAWPVDAAELAPFCAQAEVLLGVDSLSYEAARFFTEASMPEPALLAGLMEIDGMLSKWTPFARRNLAATLGRSLLRNPRVCVYLHAQATELLATPDGAHVEAVRVRTPGGSDLRFEAAHFVLAAGTVETVRLLLASRSANPAGLGNAHGQVGLNFHDHLTLPAATLTGAARERVLSELRPWLVRASRAQQPKTKLHSATLHSAKLVASPELCAQLDINPILAHLTLEEPEDAGIAAVRALLRACQREGLPAALRTHAGRLPAALLETLRLAWSAQAHGRRYVSPRAQVKLYLNTAQDAPSASRIILSDRPGSLPQAVVDRRVTSRELRTLRRFAGWLRKSFAAQGLKDIAWDPALLAEDGDLPSLDDARHAMGGACMGVDPRSSVVDADMAVHGVDNLSIASAATYPTGAAHLPTLPLMALTLRLGERLAALR
jgi:choline dehydrogenase-like flavoprotein